jgi:hypothetical protein
MRTLMRTTALVLRAGDGRILVRFTSFRCVEGVHSYIHAHTNTTSGASMLQCFQSTPVVARKLIVRTVHTTPSVND